MSKIRYTMRFYRAHDLDLITFIETHEFNIAHAVYSSLSAFSKGEVFVIEIPPRRVAKLPDLQRVYTRILILDSEKDAEAVAVLSLIRPGYRNSFLKNLLRQYLCNPMSEEFLENSDDANYFYGLFEIFRKGKRSVQAGSIRKRKKKGKGADKSIEGASGKKTEIKDTDETLKSYTDEIKKTNDARDSAKRNPVPNISTDQISRNPVPDSAGSYDQKDAAPAAENTDADVSSGTGSINDESVDDLFIGIMEG